MQTHITADTDAVAIGDVTAMALDGLCKIKADDLSADRDEIVTVWEERVDGDYDPAYADGKVIELTYWNPAVTLLAKGNYKCTKTATTNAVAVGYEN